MLQRHRLLRTRRKHLPPTQTHQIARRFGAALQILAHKLARRLTENKIDFLERLILRLGHKQQLIEPSQHSDAAVKPERQPDPPHRALHVREEVRHEPGAEEEGDVRGLHAVAAEVGRVDFRGQHPGEAGVGAEEALVQDQAGEVEALGAGGVGAVVDQVAAADEDEADEEAREHGAGPEAPPEALHVEDGGDGAEEEGAAADERHEDGLFGVEADLVHQRGHVVHDGVDAGELAEEDHDVGVDDGAARARDGEEVQPDIGFAAAGVVVFFLHGVAHDEELFAVGL